MNQMKIVEQSYRILEMSDPRLIELAGRVAYKSEDKITDDSYKDFIKMIAKRDHTAVLEHSMMSVLFVTDRGVSHEIVRHRVASFTQESTRFVNYSKGKFGSEIQCILPYFFEHKNKKDFNDIEYGWWYSVILAEKTYLGMIEHGLAPQAARSVLPNSLKTEIVVTANFREWRHIFKLRAISKAAHPQMRDLMIPLYNEVRNKYPEVFEMGEPE